MPRNISPLENKSSHLWSDCAHVNQSLREIFVRDLLGNCDPHFEKDTSECPLCKLSGVIRIRVCKGHSQNVRTINNSDKRSLRVFLKEVFLTKISFTAGIFAERSVDWCLRDKVLSDTLLMPSTGGDTFLGRQLTLLLAAWSRLRHALLAISSSPVQQTALMNTPS